MTRTGGAVPSLGQHTTKCVFLRSRMSCAGYLVYLF